MRTSGWVDQGRSARRLHVVIGLELTGVFFLALAQAWGAGTSGPKRIGEYLPFQAQRQSSSGCTPSQVSSLDQKLSQGAANQARGALADLLQCPALDSDLLLQAGGELAEKDLYPEASQAFSRCVQDYPTVFECHYNLALVLLAQQRSSEALAALADAPRGPEEQELARHNLRGKIYKALDRPKLAEQDFRVALSGAPQNENYALDLGLFYIWQRAYATAITVFEGGANYHPTSPFLNLGIALAQFLGGHEADSVETCRKLLTFDPDFPSARLLMAFALYNGGQDTEAEKTAAEGLRAGHPHPYLYYVHAAALLRLQSKDYERMLRELTLASNGIPRCSLCYFTEGKVHEAMKNPQTAIADLEKAVALDPGYSEAWYRLAFLYARVGRPEDAARCYAQFRKIKVAKATRETEMMRDLFAPKQRNAEELGTPP